MTPRGVAPGRIAVLGAGAWGTALAVVLAQASRAVDLVTRDAGHATDMATGRENRRRLPGVALPEGISPTADPGVAAVADLLVAAVPAQTLRAALGVLPPLRRECPVVVCAKGIETHSGKLPSEVAAEVLPGNPPAALSGPSFAADVGRGRPTAVTMAAVDGALAEHLARIFARPAFRVYFTDDLVGVEVGGAAKNVLAIACGIASGLDLGPSAVAALVARGFAELSRYAAARGARSETLMGLSGLGDLVLTASSAQSRNFSYGQDIGRGLTPSQAGAGRLAEGAATAAVLADLARTEGVEMPIVDAVADIVAERLAPADAIGRLLARPMGPEITERGQAWRIG